MNGLEESSIMLREENSKQSIEIIRLEQENKILREALGIIKETGAIGDIYCGDKCSFPNRWYSLQEFVEISLAQLSAGKE